MLEAFVVCACIAVVAAVGYVVIKCVAHAIDTVVELVL